MVLFVFISSHHIDLLAIDVLGKQFPPFFLAYTAYGEDFFWFERHWWIVRDVFSLSLAKKG